MALFTSEVVNLEPQIPACEWLPVNLFFQKGKVCS